MKRKPSENFTGNDTNLSEEVIAKKRLNWKVSAVRGGLQRNKLESLLKYRLVRGLLRSEFVS